MVSVTAREVAPPPAWALMERNLIKTLATAVDIFKEKYIMPSGMVVYVQDVDDVYEVTHNWGLFYSLGGPDRVMDIALDAWNSCTRFFGEENDAKDRGPKHHFYMPQLQNEYWNLHISYNSDPFHIGEGSQSFYEFGLGNPYIDENIARARRFAGLYLGEDTKAPNYDPKYKIIRSPFHSSAGPLLSSRMPRVPLLHSTGKTTGVVELVKHWLEPGMYGGYSHRALVRDWERWAVAGKRPRGRDVNKLLYPTVKDLEPDWDRDPKRREEVIDLFDKIALNNDIPDNLGMTSMVANAYLYTGDERYKNWIMDYVGAWLERTRKNNGIIPDNVGPTGKIGEHRNGQWWGGLHGWNSDRGAARFMMGVIAIGAQNAHLVSGDKQFLDLSRSQLQVLLDNSKTDESGQLLVPNCYGPDGWHEYVRMDAYEPSHLYHASAEQRDYDMLVRVREGDRQVDWNEVEPARDRGGGTSEAPRVQYYAGLNPDWPEKILTAETKFVTYVSNAMRLDDRDTDTMLEENRWPPKATGSPARKDYGCEPANPLAVKGLTQVTTGSPQNIYNGGLHRGLVRYFDMEKVRPGLPEDVAALVDEIRADRVGVQLVNTSMTETRRLIVQSGIFGEHEFTDVTVIQRYSTVNPLDPIQIMYDKKAVKAEETNIRINGKYLAVELPPATKVRLSFGLKRNCNKPSYAFPWKR